ncbi:proton-conducting transporter transmembrane domain-containing protein [Alishewanella longhuensis]
MADIAVRLTAVEDPKMVTLVAMLFLIAFSIRAAAFPLFFWLPANTHPQFAVSAIFAGLLTKVGVYALYRVFKRQMFTGEVEFTHQILIFGVWRCLRC